MYEELIDYVRDVRISKGITMTEISRALGIHENTISSWEHHRSAMPLSSADTLLDCLGITFTIGRSCDISGLTSFLGFTDDDVRQALRMLGEPDKYGEDLVAWSISIAKALMMAYLSQDKEVADDNSGDN